MSEHDFIRIVAGHRIHINAFERNSDAELSGSIVADLSPEFALKLGKALVTAASEIPAPEPSHLDHHSPESRKFLREHGVDDPGYGE